MDTERRARMQAFRRFESSVQAAELQVLPRLRVLSKESLELYAVIAGPLATSSGEEAKRRANHVRVVRTVFLRELCRRLQWHY